MTMGAASFQRWLDSSVISRQELDAIVDERMETVESLQPLETSLEPENEPFEEVPPQVSGLPKMPAQSVAGMQDFEPGEIIVREGEEADKFFIIAQWHR